MSILTIDDLRRNSRHDASTNCWHWLGGSRNDGTPAIHTLCHRRMDKVSMTGTRAVWNIAHGRVPDGAIVYRRCCCRDCVQPAHMALAYSRSEVGQAMRRSGHLKGTHLEARRASAAKGRAAKNVQDTPDDLVRQIRAAQGTNRQVAERLGLRLSTVSNIRNGRRRCNVTQEVQP